MDRIYMTNKYFAKKVTYKNIQFDSKKEYERYVYLEMLLKEEKISELKVHPEFPLMVNGTKIGRYTADFTYKDKTGNVVVEDVKSKYTKTRDYSLRKRILATYNPPIHIKEIM